LSDKDSEKQEGYEEYQKVIKEASETFGMFDARTIGFYCYFALHFVQIKDWKLSHKHIDHILSVEMERTLQDFEKNVISDLFTDYCKAINAMFTDSNNNNNHSFLNEFGEWLKQKILIIHEKQLLFANDINNNHFQQVNKRNNDKNEVQSTENKEKEEESKENTNNSSIITMKKNKKEDGFKYDFKEDHDPKVNVLAMIQNHIKLFINIEDIEKAYSLIVDVIDPQKNLNKSSTLLSSYFSNVTDIKKSDIDPLVALYQEITDKYKENKQQEVEEKDGAEDMDFTLSMNINKSQNNGDVVN